jgi:hypothetical protein
MKLNTIRDTIATVCRENFTELFLWCYGFISAKSKTHIELGTLI